MYLEELKLSAAKKKNSIKLVIAAILAIAFISGIIRGLMGDKVLRDGMTTYIICIFPVLYWIYFLIRRRMFLERARQYQALFLSDSDGILPLPDIAQKMGRYERDALVDLEQLLRMGLLVDCSLEKGNPSMVILQKGNLHSERFTTIRCANCGATCSIRVGFLEHCSYCGSPLQAKFRDQK